MHLVTDQILGNIPDISRVRIGMLNLFLQHTSASITINENCDPSVRKDMEMSLNTIVSTDFPYTHIDEGEDDMPGHVKSSLFGVSLNIPITNGQLALGQYYIYNRTWQGIWLCEHRDRGGPRSIVATINGTT